MVTESKKWKLVKDDFKKIGKGALIATVGAVATVLLELIPGIDFGQYTAMIVAVNSILCNMAIKWASTTKYK